MALVCHGWEPKLTTSPTTIISMIKGPLTDFVRNLCYHNYNLGAINIIPDPDTRHAQCRFPVQFGVTLDVQSYFSPKILFTF